MSIYWTLVYENWKKLKKSNHVLREWLLFWNSIEINNAKCIWISWLKGNKRDEIMISFFPSILVCLSITIVQSICQAKFNFGSEWKGRNRWTIYGNIYFMKFLVMVAFNSISIRFPFIFYYQITFDLIFYHLKL